MILSEDQMKMIASILILVVAGACALKKLTGKDLLTPLLGRGMIMQVFYILVALSVAYIVYILGQKNSLI
jgi:uncharacterized membrane protein YuzA (DUF378 family)